MAPSIFPEKDFSQILNDLNGYVHVFADRIRERGRYSFANENTDVDVYYCPNLVKKFSISINPSTINLDQNCFVIHFDSGDLISC